MRNKVIHIHLEKVTSTNTWVKQNYKTLNLFAITRVSASIQTQGRGRLNHTWISPRDQNIYITYFFTLPKKTLSLNNIAQLMSLSIAEVLEYYDLQPLIRWPNDLLINGKKIAGILVETIDLNETYGIILGVGINVNMPKDLLDTIGQPATSFLNEKGEPFSLNDILVILEKIFLTDLSLFENEGFSPFFSNYASHLIHKEKPITIKQGKALLTGTFHSLNPDGSLNLLLPTGEVEVVYSGEIVDS